MSEPASSSNLSPENSQPGSLMNWQRLAIKAEFRPVILAEMCGLSLRTVQRHFKTHYKTTLSDWIRCFRLQLAYDRLRLGEPIKCVAYDLGYKQLSHFSRDFKKVYGCAPRFLNQSGASGRLESIAF